MNDKEQKRLLVLNQVLAGQLTVGAAAHLLGLSQRQVWRVLAAYRENGAAALVHGNRGRKPANAIDPGLRNRVVELARGKYAGLNHQHLTEKLNEEEGIGISRATVRRILREDVQREAAERAPEVALDIPASG